MMDLTGRKVNIKCNVNVVESFGKRITYTSYSLDDPSFEAMVKEMYPDYRIILPGQMNAADWKPFRFNVFINEDGIVRDTQFG